MARPDGALFGGRLVAYREHEMRVRRAFRDAAFTLRRRIELFASLPFDKLSHLALQDRLDAIGRI